MLFIKVVNGEAVGFPITFREIKSMHKNVSFPKDFSSEHLEIIASLGFEPVPLNTEDRFTANANEVVKLTTPEKVDGVWRRRYVSRPRSIKEITDRLELIRTSRNSLLYTTDWVENPSVRAGKSAEWCQAWDAYRQQLRDITDSADLFKIKFPDRPTIDE
jgi:hypothetical protein